MKPVFQIRDYEPGDAPSLAENANNPNVAQFLREIFPSPYPVETAEWWVSEGWKGGKGFNQAIVVDEQCIGGIGVSFFEAEQRYNAELGYWIGETYWGKGIVSEAINQFTQDVFAHFDVRRLFSLVAPENIGSIKVLEKCGFVREGVLRQAMFLRGVFYDEIIYAKLRQE